LPCAALVLLWVAGAPAGATQPQARAADLDTLATLRAFVFDTTLSTSGVTHALVFRDRGYSFGDLEDVNEYNIVSAHVVTGTAQRFTLEDVPLESPYWWAMRTAQGARTFIHSLSEILGEELQHPARIGTAEKHTALEKALAQRDLFHAYSLVFLAGERANDADIKTSAARIEQVIAVLFARMLLTEHDYADLESALPKVTPRGFTSTPTYSLSDSYLPGRVLSPDASWTEIPSGGPPFRHFQDYGGRSFVKIYVRAPDMRGEEIIALWQQLFRKHGHRLHSEAVTEPTPRGLETVLVRSFGVFLEGGIYRDSFWPEEVTIRVFKYPQPRVDHESSDFRGTLFFRYRMSRAALLREPASLGLQRVMDDDIQFYGFFGEVPDPLNAYSDTVTTLRANCIACHEELFYGLNTIFSFERNPEASVAGSAAQNQMLLVRPDGNYELTTQEYTSLQESLRALTGH
jgi:hypothetical protein